MSQGFKVKRFIPLAVLALSLLSGFLMVRPVEDWVRMRMEELRVGILENLKKEYGLVLTYERLDYGILMGIRVSNARLSWTDGESFVDVSNLSLDYSLWYLIQADYARAITGLNLNTATLVMDLDKRREFLVKIGLISSTDDGRPFQLRNVNDLFQGLARSLPRGLAFKVRNVDLQVLAQGIGTSARVDSASLLSREDELDMDLGLSFRLDLPRSMIPAVLGAARGSWIKSSVNLSAHYFTPRRELQISLGTSAIDTPWFVVKPQNFRVLLEDNVLNLVKVEDDQALDAVISYIQDKQMLNLHLESQGWSLLGILSPKVDAGELGRTLSESLVDMNLDLNWNFASQTLAYGGTLGASGWIPGLGASTVFLAAQGDGKGLHVDQARLSAQALDLAYHGKISYDDLGLSGEISARSTTLVPGADLGLTAVVGGSLKAGFAIPKAQAQWGTYGIDLSLGRIFWGSKTLDMDCIITKTGDDPAKQIAASISLDTLNWVPENARIEFKSWTFLSKEEPVLKILSMVMPEPNAQIGNLIPERIFLEGGLSYRRSESNTGNSVSDFGVSALRIQLGHRDYLVSSLIDLNQGLIDIRDTQVKAGSIDGQISLKADLTKPDMISGSGSLRGNVIPDTAFNFTYSYQKLLDIQTNNGIYLSVGMDGVGLEGFVKIDRFPMGILGIAGMDGKLSTNGSYKFVSDKDWFLQLEQFDMGFMKLNPLMPDRKIRFWAEKVLIDGTGIHARTINAQDTVSMVSGSLDLAWDGLTGRNLKLDADLVKKAQALNPSSLIPMAVPESYGIHARLEDGRLSGGVQIRSSPLSRFASEGLKGLIQADIALSGTLDQPGVSGSFKVAQGNFNKDTLTADGKFSALSSEFNLDKVRLGLGVNFLQVDSLTYKNRALSGQGRITNSEWGGAGIPWVLRSSWSAEGIWKGLDGSLRLTELPVWISPSQNWELKASAQGGGISLVEQEQKSLQVMLYPDFHYTLDLASPFPVHTQAEGYLRGTKIEANFRKIVIDARISKYFPFASTFWMPEGRLEGELRMVGDINDPSFYGYLKGTNLKAWVSYLDDPVLVPQAWIRCEDRTFRLLPVQGSVNKGLIKASMSMEISRLAFQSLNMEAATEGDQGVRMHGTFPGIKVQGNARGHMGFQFLPSKMVITGEIVGENADLGLGPWGGETEKTLDDTGRLEVEEYGMQVDLGFTSAKGVAFYWPSKEVPVLTSYLNPSQVVRFVYDSIKGTYSLKGQVKSRGGSITYLNRDFILRETLLDFNESELGFDPLVTFKAELRTVIDNANYKLSLIADHQRLSKLFQQTARIESEPPLTQEQIASLLSGDTISEDNNTNWESLVSTAVDATSQLAFMKNILDPVKELVGADILVLRLGLLKNMTSGFLNLLSPIDNQIGSLGKYLDDSSLLIGWYLGDDLYLESGLQAHEAEVSYGKNPNYLGIDLGFELSMEWTTPLFVMKWMFEPQAVDASEFFLPDNTLSFTFDLIR